MAKGGIQNPQNLQMAANHEDQDSLVDLLETLNRADLLNQTNFELAVAHEDLFNLIIAVEELGDADLLTDANTAIKMNAHTPHQPLFF